MDNFRWKGKHNHHSEIYCQKLRQFKNLKIIHLEDIEDQIFCNLFWALPWNPEKMHNMEHEYLGLLEEI